MGDSRFASALRSSRSSRPRFISFEQAERNLDLEVKHATPPEFNVGVYGSEIHEMAEMAEINFGQYSHNNQPVHHVLYLYTAAGRPDKAAVVARRVMDELYSPDAYSGDEDTGSMAAWYILSALGFFPVCPAKPEYMLGAPLSHEPPYNCLRARRWSSSPPRQAKKAYREALRSTVGLCITSRCRTQT